MSTIKVTNIKHEDTTDGGIQLDSSGHVTIDGQQLPTTGALSNRNLVINGAMQVAQRGTSSTDNGYGTVDRWKSGYAQASITQSQQTLSSGSPYDEGFRNFFRVAVTSTSSATNAYAQIEQRIEAQNLAQSGWQYTSSSSYVTCSFWARSSLAGTYYVGYRNSDNGTLQYVKSFALSANTWTKVTQTIPGASTVTINNDNGDGLKVIITPHYGTSYTGSGVTAETWETISNSEYYPDYAQNWTNTASATFDVTGVQLEVGEVATPFEHRSYGDELQRCKRYYQELDLGTNNSVLHMVFGRFGASNGNAFAYFPFPTAMRATPSFSFLGSTYDSSGYTGDPTLGAATINGAQLNSTNSFNAGANAFLRPNNDSGDFLRLTFTSEL